MTENREGLKVRAAGRKGADGEKPPTMYVPPAERDRRRAEHLAQLEAAKAPCAWCGVEWSGVAWKHPGCAEALAGVFDAVVAEVEQSGDVFEISRKGVPEAVLIRPDVLDEMRRVAGEKP